MCVNIQLEREHPHDFMQVACEHSFADATAAEAPAAVVTVLGFAARLSIESSVEPVRHSIANVGFGQLYYK